MQLILLDKRNAVIRASNTEPEDLSSKATVRYDFGFSQVFSPEDLLDLQNDFNRGVAQQLISELVEGQLSVMGVVLLYKGTKTEYDFIINCTDYQTSSLLEKLGQRFEDKVTFSASISTSDAPQRVIVSARGLRVQHGNRIRVPFFMSKRDCDNLTTPANLRNPNLKFHIKISAHIPDEEIMFPEEMKAGARNTKRILENSIASDVTIIAENGGEIQAHRCFLMASSPVFRAMFLHDFEEARTGRVLIKDISENGVRAFLRYVYYGNQLVPQDNIFTAFELMFAGHKYEVLELVALMKKFFLEKRDEDLDTYLAFRIFMFARNIPYLKELQEKTDGILQMNFDELKKIPEYQKLSRKKHGICGYFARKAAALKRKRSLPDLRTVLEKRRRRS